MAISRAQTPAHSADQDARGHCFPERHPSPFRLALRVLAAWMMRSAERRALRDLAQSGHLLADIGLTQEQALGEAAKPFWRR